VIVFPMVTFECFVGVVYYNFEWDELKDYRKLCLVVGCLGLVCLHFVY